MTFDLAGMIADRDAGTPADKWVTMNWKTAKDDQVRADMRRENNVPLLEAEIIRLTARVAELEGALMDIRSHYTHDQSAFAGLVARAALSTPTEEPKT